MIDSDAAESPSPLRLACLVGAALLGFAGNSLLCRQALGRGAMDPATFTLLRLGSGALVLGLIVRWRGGRLLTPDRAGLAGPLSLFAYAALFSWAYVRIPAGVGALVLFAFVQITMLTAAVRSSVPPGPRQWLGIALALAGVALLTLRGATAPDPLGVGLMAGGGVAWGFYSLLGRRSGAPLTTTAQSFLRAVPLAAGVLAVMVATSARGPRLDAPSVAFSIASGALASGLGYAIWYRVLPHLDTTRAAVVQLAVPLLAASGGVVLLGEQPSARLAASATAILGGMALTIRRGRERSLSPASIRVASEPPREPALRG